MLRLVLLWFQKYSWWKSLAIASATKRENNLYRLAVGNAVRFQNFTSRIPHITDRRLLEYSHHWLFVRIVRGMKSPDTLIVRRTRLSTVDDWTFSVAAACVWNELPRRVTSASSPLSFLAVVWRLTFSADIFCSAVKWLVSLSGDTLITVVACLLTRSAWTCVFEGQVRFVDRRRLVARQNADVSDVQERRPGVSWGLHDSPHRSLVLWDIATDCSSRSSNRYPLFMSTSVCVCMSLRTVAEMRWNFSETLCDEKLAQVLLKMSHRFATLAL